MTTEKPLRYWLLKSEPNVYPWQRLLRDKVTVWDGVRNFEARNNMRAMSVGDLVLFYHSNDGKELVGLARVSREAYPDPTAQGEDWSVVELEPVLSLKKPVSIDTIKETPELAAMQMLKRNRLSVTPVSSEEFLKILELSEMTLETVLSKSQKSSRSRGKAGIKKSIPPGASPSVLPPASGPSVVPPSSTAQSIAPTSLAPSLPPNTLPSATLPSPVSSQSELPPVKRSSKKSISP